MSKIGRFFRTGAAAAGLFAGEGAMAQQPPNQEGQKLEQKQIALDKDIAEAVADAERRITNIKRENLKDSKASPETIKNSEDSLERQGYREVGAIIVEKLEKYLGDDKTLTTEAKRLGVTKTLVAKCKKASEPTKIEEKDPEILSNYRKLMKIESALLLENGPKGPPKIF